MKITGRAITQKERDRLMGFVGVSKADEIAIGCMKMEDGRYYSVARFFKNDKFLFIHLLFLDIILTYLKRELWESYSGPLFFLRYLVIIFSAVVRSQFMTSPILSHV